MSKEKKQTTVEIIDEAVKPKDLPHLAYSIAKDENGKWNVVTLKYNLATKEAEVYSLEQKDFKDLAIEQFKIDSARNLLHKPEA